MLLALTDAFDLTQVTGPRFTRRGFNSTQQNQLTQSRLDRVYVGSHKTWIFKILELRHATETILSDHDPVILSLQLAPDPSSQYRYKKSSSFKANSIVLKSEQNIE
jgi:endonuclease/exonuclease/phosphatase family metal-dependent hydrolase